MGTCANMRGTVNSMLAQWRSLTTEFLGSILLGATAVTRYPVVPGSHLHCLCQKTMINIKDFEKELGGHFVHNT